MTESYQRLRDGIYQKLHDLSLSSVGDKEQACQLWYYDGNDYFGADLNVVFTGKNSTDVILKACSYVRDHAKRRNGDMIDLLQHHIEFLIDHCSGVTDVKEQVDIIIEGIFNNDTLYLKPV